MAGTATFRRHERSALDASSPRTRPRSSRRPAASWPTGNLRAAAAPHPHGLDQGAAGRSHEPGDGAGRFPPDGAEPPGHGRSGRDPRGAPRRLRGRGGRGRYVGRNGRAGASRSSSGCAGLLGTGRSVSLPKGAQKAAVPSGSHDQVADQGFLDLGAMRLEYRMIGPRPEAAPVIVMLHEGLGCVGLWGEFPDRLAACDRRRRLCLFARRLRPLQPRVELPRPAHLHAGRGA